MKEMNIVQLKEMRRTDSSYSLIIREHQLYYHVAGKGNPVLILHGFGRTGYAWLHRIPGLIQQRQVIAVDLPGHGRSRLSGDWCLHEVTSLLATWLQQMKLPPMTVIGHSIGGAIAIHLATLLPELIDRLVLVNTIGIPLQIDLPTLIGRGILSW